MHPQLTVIVAEQHIADLRRAADHDRIPEPLAATASNASGDHTPEAA
jgi:hypothetical protein